MVYKISVRLTRGSYGDVTYPISPEHWHHLVRSYNTVEQTEHDKEERQNVRDDSKGRRERTNPLTPTGDEQEEQHGHQENVSRSRAIGR